MPWKKKAILSNNMRNLVCDQHVTILVNVRCRTQEVNGSANKRQILWNCSLTKGSSSWDDSSWFFRQINTAMVLTRQEIITTMRATNKAAVMSQNGCAITSSICIPYTALGVNTSAFHPDHTLYQHLLSCTVMVKDF